MKHTQKGFTLVELLVVVAIIGLLAGIAVVSVNSTRVRARDARRIADIKQIQNALELYNNANSGVYPTEAADATLGAGAELAISSTGGIGAAAGDIFLNVVPKDPSANQNYVYKLCGAVAPAAKACLAYSIAFTTEASTSLGAAGNFCASPTGIAPAPAGGCAATTAP